MQIILLQPLEQSHISIFNQPVKHFLIQLSQIFSKRVLSNSLSENTACTHIAII